MPAYPAHRPTRSRLLDAAEHLLRTAGLAGATTKEIAGAAQCSQGTLYKHFATKEELLGCVLRERLRSLALPGSSGIPDLPDANTGSGSDSDSDSDVCSALACGLEECCLHLARRALCYYERALPLLGPLLADPGLLSQHRAARSLTPLAAPGPHELFTASVVHLERLRGRGLIHADADVHAAVALLLGACFQHTVLRLLGVPEQEQETTKFTAAVTRTVAASLVLPGPGHRRPDHSFPEEVTHA
ncbi:TetR/AcrR family transcriptional regulator [Streptomyces sp. T-3]|nr:TetR/AcrR family transcriptional regulator [Streptomyces sp. T-3]